MPKTLVTGGVRSGKSAYAERLFRPGDPVTYVAPGPVYDDADWNDRIAVHRARRPEVWTTVETTDLAAAVREAPGPVLVDCLGTWVTAVLDELGGWQNPRTDWGPALDDRVDAVCAAWSAAAGSCAAVTNEVGLGVVPEHRSGRVFRDELGTLNQKLAAVCDDVILVIAGRTLRL